MTSKLIRCGVLAALALGATQARALVILDDNFNAENGGAGVLNYAGFANWTVSDGTVDLIGNGYFDFQPGNGLYVDLDGSTRNPGKMTSTAFSLAPGNYKLSYQLAGTHRGSADSATVAVETGIWSVVHTLQSSDPFTSFSKDFTLAAAQAITITFENQGQGADNIGLLLDNVKLERIDQPTVPEGASTLGLLAGVALLGGWVRSRRQ